MIKNPQIGQTVFFFEDCKILEGKINHLFTKNYRYPAAVEIDFWYYRPNSKIYSSKELTQKNLKNEISKTLKSLNQEIKQLSKKREKLASKLASLI